MGLSPGRAVEDDLLLEASGVAGYVVREAASQICAKFAKPLLKAAHLWGPSLSSRHMVDEFKTERNYECIRCVASPATTPFIMASGGR